MRLQAAPHHTSADGDMQARTRTAAPETAPACGLYLLRVHYNDWPYRDAGPPGGKSDTELML
eukprot:28175-Eustigmatos_ZCMA.PRE.1